MNGIFSSTSEMFYILSRVSDFGIYSGVRGAGGLLLHVPQRFIFVLDGVPTSTVMSSR